MSDFDAVQTTGPAAFLSIWTESFTQVLGQIAGAEFPCALESQKPPEFPASGETDTWILITASGALRGEMILRLAPASTLRLGQLFMSEAPSPEAQLTPEHRESILELLRQVAGVVVTSGKDRWGEFQLLVEAAAAPPTWPPGETFWISGGDDIPAAVYLEFGLSAGLLAQLRVAPAAAVSRAQERPESAPSPIPASAADAPSPLQLLHGVQLALTLRFGSRTLPLRDILDLNPGSVVELDRKVQDPVELLLDGKIIARGEVVVIEGSYGLRVREICQPGGSQ